MKKLIFFIIFLFILSTPQLSKAADDFIINDFKSDIAIQSGGKVTIEETIEIFFYESRYGIYRDMPHTYKSSTGEKIYTEIEVNSVTDGIKKIPYEVSRNEANLRIKIGDPNKTVSGSQKYVIKYSASGALIPFEEYDELYWNVTGNNWPVPIEKSSAIVSLPQDGIVQSACYIGKYGATTPCLINKINEKEVQFTSPRNLSSGEGLTVAVGYKKGMMPILVIEPPKTLLEILFSPTNLTTFFLVLIVGISLLLRMWWQKGRDYYYERKSLHDPEQKEKIMPLGAYEPIGAEYEPPLNLRPAEIGVIMDERADTLDVSATIVDLAVRGYLIIKEEPKKWIFGKEDYILIKTDKQEEKLLGYEKKLLDKLFSEKKEARLSELKHTFYKSLKTVKNELYKEVVSKKLFEKNPQSVRSKYFVFALLLTFFSLLGFLLILKNIPNSFLLGPSVGAAVCGIFFIIISFFMPRKSALGREVYRKARGYELFVSGTEKYRQPFFEKENIFMEVLPYAIVFGVTKKLADAMKEMGIKTAQPNWYIGTAAFNAYRFTSNINNFSNSLSSAIASSPAGSGSGGGGFSGGGFGGGGGGSW